MIDEKLNPLGFVRVVTTDELTFSPRIEYQQQKQYSGGALRFTGIAIRTGVSGFSLPNALRQRFEATNFK